MGKIVGDAPCPQCRKGGRDSSGNHLMLFEDGGSYCNRCGYKGQQNEKQSSRGDPVGPVKDKVSKITELSSRSDNGRGIKASTAEHFGVKHSVDESNGVHDKTYYPIELTDGTLVAYKKRTLPKSFQVISNGSMKDVDIQFFGQSVCPNGGKKLLITGGEEDCLAAWEMLKERYPQYTPAVVSLPWGENLSCISKNRSFLDSFEEILISTDMDKVGREACDSICKQIGEKCKVVILEEKDASDMRVKDKKNEFINSFFRAKEYRPSSIILIEDISDAIVKPVEWGLTYPFEQLTELTYGLKDGGEIIGIGAGPGAGKSTLMHAIQSWLIFAHSEKIALFDIEEGAVMAGKHLIGGIINKPMHKPDCIYDQEEAREAIRSVAGKVEFFDGHPEWVEVRDNIRYFASKGVRVFFIDPISALVAHLSASEGNEVLGGVMKDLMKFRKELGLTFFHVNHLNNPAGGKDHGAGAKVYGSQFSGSRAMWKYSTSLWGLQRNQLAEDDEEKNTVVLSVIKDRLGGNTGSFELSYNREKGILEETGYEF